MDTSAESKKPRRLPPNAGKGRPKGTPNKLTASVKACIEQVAAGLGGPERMLEWCRESPEHERAFWERIYPKLLPLTVQGDKTLPLGVVVIPSKEA